MKKSFILGLFLLGSMYIDQAQAQRIQPTPAQLTQELTKAEKTLAQLILTYTPRETKVQVMTQTRIQMLALQILALAQTLAQTKGIKLTKIQELKTTKNALTEVENALINITQAGVQEQALQAAIQALQAALQVLA